MATSSSGKGPFKVGVIIGSQRVVRICPTVAQFVVDILELHQSSASKTTAGQPEVEFSFLDIAAFDLPLTVEPAMPAHITDRPAGYTTEKTRVWSAAVEPFDAFIFVTPQYNWGLPAGLKNAIDHLFNEWSGKPAIVVAYGGHGGTLSAAALITVLTGCFMRVVKRAVCMKYPDISYLAPAVSGEAPPLDAKNDEGIWADQRSLIIELWEEVLAMLVAGDKSKVTKRSPGLQQLWDDALAPLAAIEAKHTTVPK